jgi:hypothetical protein
MDLFEFVSGMVSVILAFVLAQLFMGLAHLVQTRASVRPSLLHSGWLLVIFVITVQHWWSLWDFRDLDWTYPYVLYSMLCPSLLFFCATLVSPSDTDEDEIDLGAYFQRVRRPLMAAFIVASIAGSLDGVLFGTEPLINRLRLQLLFVIGGAAVVLISSRAAVQRTGTAIVAAAGLAGIVIRFLPGVIA